MARVALQEAVAAPARPSRPELRLVVSKPPRRRRGVLVLVGIFVLAFGLVAARVLVEVQAAQLQQLQGAIQRAEYRERALALKVAELEAPSRVEAYAASHLGLQVPSYVNVVPGNSLASSVPLPDPQGAPGVVPLPAGVVQRGP